MSKEKELYKESLLENEGLTDSLADDEADFLINWCISLIENSDSENLEEIVNQIKNQARNINKTIASLDYQDFEKSKKYLNKIFDNNDTNDIINTLIKTDNNLDKIKYIISKL